MSCRSQVACRVTLFFQQLQIIRPWAVQISAKRLWILEMALQISGSRYLKSISEDVLWMGSYAPSASLLPLNEYSVALYASFALVSF
jgi:hypothetical protein